MGEPHAGSPKPGSSTTHATTTSSSTFTPEMRDRQARGKNPYDMDSDDSDWASGQGGDNREGGSSSSTANFVGPRRTGDPKNKERFAIHDRRRMAAQILNSTELLMMAAVRDGESIPATRLKYTRILCGLEGGSGGAARTGAGVARPSSTTDEQLKRPNLEQGQGHRNASGNPRGQRR